MFWLTQSTADEWLGVLMLVFVAWMRRPAIPLKTAVIVASGPLVWGACYCLMALGYGWFYLPISDDPTFLCEFFLTRYLDWVFIVPVALFAFLSIALTDSAERDRAWYGLMLPCTGMTVSATLFAGFWDPVVKTLLYVVFFGFSILLAVAIARIFREQAKADNVHFKKLRRDVRFLAGLWACYNVTLLLGSDGLRFFLPSVTTANFENLDFALAVAYPFIALSRVGRTREAEEHAWHHAQMLEGGPGVIMAHPRARSSGIGQVAATDD